MTEHVLSAEPTHSRWNRALPPRVSIRPGRYRDMACVDSSGAQEVVNEPMYTVGAAIAKRVLPARALF